MAQVTESIEIKATPKECYAVVSDFESYPEFVEGTSEVKIIGRSGTKTTVAYTLDMIKKVHYTLDHLGKPGKLLAWSLVEGDFMKKNQGQWTFEEVKKGITRAIYSIDIELGLFVPGTIERKLVTHHLPEMLTSFKKRIESRRAKK